MKSVFFANAQGGTLLQRDELLNIAERLLADCGDPGAWSQSPFEIWEHFRHIGQTTPPQGWKLHVSATPLSAPSVLSAVLPILFGRGCSFKMVRSRRLLTDLNEAHSPRGAAGKFITIYPSDEAQAIRLAEECHAATQGLRGPTILSDRRYRENSLVHYRYGGFRRQIVYNAEGRIVHIIYDPQGRPVPDAREAWFSLPSWVQDPFQPEVGTVVGSSAPASVILNGRYEVAQALRHANKGGVYLATDRRTGATVVVKEARPDVGTDRFGRDATDRLRVEATNLERLSGLGVAPYPIELFEQGGHLFLALEKLPGTNLRRLRRQKEGRLPADELLEHARSIAALMEACHAADIIIRDFNPNNLIVAPDGSPRAVDLEMACVAGESLPIGVGAFTPGYASPEQRRGEIPRFSDDYFSLAATLFFLATSRDPVLVEESPPIRTHRERLAEQLQGMVRSGDLPPEIAGAILEGMHAGEERCSPSRVLSHLSAPAQPGRAEPRLRVEQLPLDSRDGMPERQEEQSLEVTRSLVASVLASINPTNGLQLIQSSCAGQTSDPCNVHCGASGAGVFLLSTLHLLDQTGKDTVAELGRRVAASLKDPRGRPQGLHFGAAGAAWFLLQAAEAFSDPDLRRSACELALSLRPAPGLADITHGASGIGVTLLRFHRATGAPKFLEAAERIAGEVMAAAVDHPGGMVWPQRGPSGEKTAFYGFAHGNAGVAYFLLAVHAATGDERYLAASKAAADILVHAAEIEDGRAYWPHGPDRPTLWTYWCNGSSGVGSTLIRMYQVTGLERYRELAEMAAGAVYRHRWYSALGHCHGLAGNGEFIVDLHQILGDESYLRMAHELSDVLFSHRICQDGRVVFADESQTMVSPDYGTGTAGIGAFFHRLGTGGARLFMLDDLFERYGGRKGAVPEEALVLAGR